MVLYRISSCLFCEKKTKTYAQVVREIKTYLFLAIFNQIYIPQNQLSKNLLIDFQQIFFILNTQILIKFILISVRRLKHPSKPLKPAKPTPAKNIYWIDRYDNYTPSPDIYTSTSQIRIVCALVNHDRRQREGLRREAFTGRYGCNITMMIKSPRLLSRCSHDPIFNASTSITTRQLVNTFTCQVCSFKFSNIGLFNFILIKYIQCHWIRL